MIKHVHPIIIELYGLPGCGKTTLRDFLVQEPNGNVSYSLMTELSQQYRKLSLYRKFKFIPICIWFCLLRFFLSMPLLSPKEWVFYKVLFKLSLIYNYSKYAVGLDYIVIDHGIIQAVVSLMNGKIDHLSETQMKHFQQIIRKLPFIYFVYCSLPVEESLVRIRIRKRNHGRLDVIQNDNNLREMIAKEYVIFRSFFQGLDSINNIISQCIDSSKSPEETFFALKLIVEK